MKIVVTGTRGIPNILGGVETHCEELYPRIALKEYDITVIRRKNYVQDSLKEYREVQLIDISTIKQKSFEAIVHTFKAILKAKKLHADVVHIHAIGPAITTPLARLLGLKVVFTHHGHDYNRDKWGTVAKAILKYGERIGCMYANEVIVISDVINQFIQQKYKRHNAYVIYNGVSVPNFISSTAYIESMGIKPQQYIFAMGRFVPEKKFHHLIRAYSSLGSGKYPLVLAGDADFEDAYSKELKNLAKHENVILTGFIKGEKLQSLLTHARAFVLPSSHEGLPISLLEAMSYRLPVIASDIPANLAVGLPSGCYFPAGNEQALADCMDKITKEKFQPVNYNMEKYDWNHIAEQVAKVYDKIIKHQPCQKLRIKADSHEKNRTL
ncbi:MAG: glycosyltransferase family 4 protein [Prevotellaceae bacterium]|jgi:glycosyltransferase involved in cell wall biosynthesis|nr:glycosyltransferase family 4 protein [Prevotellaceae bacterium]